MGSDQILISCFLVVFVSGAYILYLRHCEWNPIEAADYVTKNASRKSVGLCALYIRRAINAGGIPLSHRCGNAWRYKYILPLVNFKEVDKDDSLMVGDIVVFQPIGGRRYGHIAMWNGKQWVSDFKQRNFIVHSDYKKKGCEYAVFRRVTNKF